MWWENRWEEAGALPQDHKPRLRESGLISRIHSVLCCQTVSGSACWYLLWHAYGSCYPIQCEFIELLAILNKLLAVSSVFKEIPSCVTLPSSGSALELLSHMIKIQTWPQNKLVNPFWVGEIWHPRYMRYLNFWNKCIVSDIASRY